MKRSLLVAAGLAALLLLVLQARTQPPAPASPDAIEQVTTLTTPRAAHTATALPSGRVLVVGGMGSGGASLASTEIVVDLSAGQVAAGPDLSEARVGHTATALPDGRVLIAGGYNGSYLTSIEIYNPDGGFAPAGHLLEGRSGHTATLLPDGRVLFVGGVGQGWTFLASAELFDLATGTSQTMDTMSVPRESHTATLLEDGRVLVVGGHSGRRPALIAYSSAELFDPVTREFTNAGALQTARHKHDAVRLADGRVLVVGGADRTDRTYFATTEICDPSGKVFTPGPTMRHTRYKIAGTVVLLPDSSVLVPGGARRPELLEARATAFGEIAGEFPAAYHFATATLLPSGEVAIIGGYDDDNQNTGGVWRYRGPPTENDVTGDSD